MAYTFYFFPVYVFLPQWSIFEFQIPLNPITHGLAFHQHLSRDADPPYNEEHFNQIRDAISERAIVLSNAAEDNGLAAVCVYN